MSNLAIYIHWPFCKSKCPYCDFNSHVRDGVNHEDWLSAYLKEIDYFADRLGDSNVTSIFFGGGTPSLMEAKTVEGILKHISKIWDVSKDVEITLEANPTSIERDKFQEFQAVGINRVSLGVQALNDRDLKFLGREHSVKEALEAVDVAREIFGNYSFDLIYARPGQTVEKWGDELNKALRLINGHMSLYQLTIEKGTPFYSAVKNGEFQIPNPETAAKMYDLTNIIMEDNGFSAYEVSNYAKEGFESQHNLNYWRYGDYLGIGPGAHSRIMGKGKEAIMMAHSPENWLKSVNEKGCGIQSRESVEGEDLLSEILMMGLRLKEGISKDVFVTYLGKGLEQLIPESKFDKLRDFIIVNDNSIKTTEKGRMVLNSVVAELVG